MDVTKFSWAEAFNGANGKSSIALICAFMMTFTGCIVFMYSAYIKFSDGMLDAIAFATLGSGLLGIRRFTKDQAVVNMESNIETKSVETTNTATSNTTITETTK